MHRSRVSTLLIDTPSAEATSPAQFWSKVLGVDARPSPEEPQFTSLPGWSEELLVSVQAIEGEPRYHLDIETDDLEAETARLLALGAIEVAQWLDCRVLRAPGGHLLCVIPQHSDPRTFERYARIWE